MYFNKPFPLPAVTRYSAVAGVISGSDMSDIFRKFSWNYETGTGITLIWGFP